MNAGKPATARLLTMGLAALMLRSTSLAAASPPNASATTCPSTRTFAALQCRLGELEQSTSDSALLGLRQGRLLAAVRKARTALSQAELSCTANRDRRVTSGAIRTAGRGMLAFRRALVSHDAAIALPPAVRVQFLALVEPLIEDIAGFRTEFECSEPTPRGPVPSGPVPVVRPLTFTLHGTFPGVSITLQTSGGILPWDVKIVPARRYMAGDIATLLAGPAFDISVPSVAAIVGGSLTLPYDPTLLGGFPETALRLYRFDDETQFWLPVPGQQTVDTAAQTVTASIDHLSVYAILKVQSAEDWKKVFETTPIRCVPGGSGVALDVVLLIDTSGSMGGNDPDGLRVEGAKRFVDVMRPDDRVAVVDFDSIARTLLDLTAVGTGKAAIDGALELTRNASGGTNISAAVERSIDLLSSSPEGRLRIAVLLTDGDSPYDDSLTAAAAAAGIEIHTIGLGSGVVVERLRSIANGTGGTYRFLSDATDLPDLYEDLVGDLIDDGSDTDGDGITNCRERTGLFVPLVVSLGHLRLISVGSFITTKPDQSDSDCKSDTECDHLTDDVEAVAFDMTKNPAVAAEYSFLIDRGLTIAYRLVSDPNKADSDGDGADDGVERINGTDPFDGDENELGIDGLDLAPFTLFQPSRYTEDPAISFRMTVVRDGDRFLTHPQAYNDLPVRYDDDDNCVTNCGAIEDLARRRPNGNGWGACIGGHGDCRDDASQARDIVREARRKQGIFTGDGNLSKEFIIEQFFAQCALYTADGQHCLEAAIDLYFDDLPSFEAPQIAVALQVAVLRSPGVPRTANPELAKLIAGTLAKAVIGTTVLAEVIDAVTACMESRVLEVVRQVSIGTHPCEVYPMYMPGGDVRLAAEFRREAIEEDPVRIVQLYSPEEEVRARGLARRWYIGQPGCTAEDLADAKRVYGNNVHCDEFPNYSTTTSGPPLAAIRYLPGGDNSPEGARFGHFVGNRICGHLIKAPAQPDRLPFLVIPNPSAPKTLSHCGTFGG